MPLSPSHVTPPCPGIFRPVTPVAALTTAEAVRSPRRVIMPCNGASVTVAIPSDHVAPFNAVTAVADLDILLCPLGIVEHRADDARGIGFAVRAGKFQNLSHTVRAIQHQTHRDALVQVRRMVG